MSDVTDEIRRLEEEIAKLPPTPDPTLPSWWSAQEAMTISAATLIFGLLALLIVAFLLRKERDSDAILRAVGTTLVLFSALFLVVAGYSDSQVAPAFGLLGAIAGYLFGKSGGARPKETEPGNQSRG